MFHFQKKPAKIQHHLFKVGLQPSTRKNSEILVLRDLDIDPVTNAHFAASAMETLDAEESFLI